MKKEVEKWRCRSCGIYILTDQVVWVMHGIPLCKTCYERWRADSQKKGR